jgi:hypothetical protein
MSDPRFRMISGDVHQRMAAALLAAEERLAGNPRQSFRDVCGLISRPYRTIVTL